MIVKLVRYTEKPLEAIASAASNCYDSQASEKIAKFCYQSGHLSVFEFCDFHFHVEGVSRALTHQLVRHRIASYAQRSQRYVEESEPKYIVPTSILMDDLAHDMYEQHMENTVDTYNWLVNNGIPKEDARSVLTNSWETVIDIKMDFRALMNFFNLRLCTRAQAEIRQLAQEMRDAILEVAPELAIYMVPKCQVHAPFCFCTESRRECCGRAPLLEDVFAAFNRQNENKTTR